MKRWSRKDEQVVWGDLCENAGALPDRCGVAEFSRKAKLLIYWSVYVPTLTCGHELWVETVWSRSQIQAVEMRFLQRVTGLSFRNTERSSNVWREL